MRFGLALLLSLGMGVTAFAAPWDVVSVPQETVTPQPISMQRGGTSDTLSTIDGLSLTQFAKNLGKVSALAISESGTLYAADEASGRIWALSDRGQDGSLDMRRPLPKRFNAPTGLAAIGDRLYVADKEAIWVLEAGFDARVLAPLTNVSSQGAHPLTVDNGALVMGITQVDKAFLARIDITSGQAEKMAEFSNQTSIEALAQRTGAPLWISTGAAMFSVESPQSALNYGYISGFALPGQYQAPEHWPASLNDTIIASQMGAEAMQLIAIPTEFGQPSGEPRILVEGFLSRSGRTAWGAPGAIIMDKRGLFFADQHNGMIWRLFGSPEEAPAPEIKIVVEDAPDTIEPTPTKAPLLIGSGIKGSLMGEASLLSGASQLKTGSTIIEAYDKAQAEAEAEKEAEGEGKKPKR